ncbi:MAG: CBS and ACT domain-containing protein [Desulfovibrio sp.]|jgi:acetoin utilization protein AcuB|nr:CBS and ACT domain-containing protein [Desulfovibrio sp.]
MLVSEWMTEKAISVNPATSVMKAARIMKENRIRRLPVLNESGVVIGIVTDRDIKEASPSKATTLDMHELYYLLGELTVRDIMRKNPVCAGKDDSVDSLAVIMIEKKIGGMPVVDQDNRLLGIITQSDIFRVLVSITGISMGGMQLAFDLPVTGGKLHAVLDLLRGSGARVISVLSSLASAEAETYRVYIRLLPLPEEDENRIIREIEKHFPSSLRHHAPGTGGLTGRQGR